MSTRFNVTCSWRILYPDVTVQATGYTPLHVATEKGHDKIVLRLILAAKQKGMVEDLIMQITVGICLYTRSLYIRVCIYNH